MDGNADEWRTAFSHTVSGLSWEDDQFLVLRWSAIDLTGQDNGLAIDDLTFSAVPEPGSTILVALGALLGVGVRRRG